MGKHIIIPDFCNTLSGCKPPNEHCGDCSHAYFYGEVISRGRNYRFEFNPQYGVVFLNADGDPRQVQPAEDNQAWLRVDQWMKIRFGKKINSGERS